MDAVCAEVIKAEPTFDVYGKEVIVFSNCDAGGDGLQLSSICCDQNPCEIRREKKNREGYHDVMLQLRV